MDDVGDETGKLSFVKDVSTEVKVRIRKIIVFSYATNLACLF